MLLHQNWLVQIMQIFWSSPNLPTQAFTSKCQMRQEKGGDALQFSKNLPHFLLFSISISFLHSHTLIEPITKTDLSPAKTVLAVQIDFLLCSFSSYLQIFLKYGRAFSCICNNIIWPQICWTSAQDQRR